MRSVRQRLPPSRAWRDFSGRNILITGGSRGLGLALAHELALQGARVALLARSEDNLRAARAQIYQSCGVEVEIVVCDLRQPAQIEPAIAALLAAWRQLDVLINNAGIIWPGPAQHKQLVEYEEAMAIHFWAPLHAMRAVIPAMKRQGGGRIVNVSSVEGLVSLPLIAPYCASKFALTGLSNALRAELAQDGIYITTVAPGLMHSSSPADPTLTSPTAARARIVRTMATVLASTSYERAARRILRACARGERWLALDTVTRLLVVADALAPRAVGGLMELANRLMAAHFHGAPPGT
jgi:short-subunit dehydrogenase